MAPVGGLVEAVAAFVTDHQPPVHRLERAVGLGREHPSQRLFIVATVLSVTVLPTLAGICLWHSDRRVRRRKDAGQKSSSRILTLDPRRSADTEASLQAGMEDRRD